MEIMKPLKTQRIILCTEKSFKYNEKIIQFKSLNIK